MIVLEAPGGFGKSTLAEQLAVGATTIVRLFLEKEDSSSRRLVTRLRDGCRRSHLVAAVEAGSSDDTDSEQVVAVVSAMARAVPDGGWLIVENAHFLGVEATQLVGALVVDLCSAHGVDPGASPGFGVGFGGDDGVSTVGWRAVVAGRAVAMTVDGALRLGADDLVFRFEETETLIQRSIVADDELARVITRDCAGWPAAIALSIAAQARGHSVLAAPLRLDTLIGGLLETDDRLSPRTLALLGHLRLVSDAIGNALGMPNLIDAIVASGLPIRMTGSWRRLPDPVREHLATTGRLTDQDLVTALEVVFANGETTMAVDMLLAANRPTDVCRLIAEIPYRQLDRLDVDEMAALLNAVPTAAVIQNLRCLAQLARAAEGRVRIGLRT